jgi:hypothetical protein
MAEPITLYSIAAASAKVMGPHLLKKFQEVYDKKKSKSLAEEQNTLATDLGTVIRTESLNNKTLQDPLLQELVDAYDVLIAKGADPKDKRATANRINLLKEEQTIHERNERVQRSLTRHLASVAPSRSPIAYAPARSEYPKSMGRARTQDSGMFVQHLDRNDALRDQYIVSNKVSAAAKKAPARKAPAKKAAAKKAPAKKAAAKKATRF